MSAVVGKGPMFTTPPGSTAHLSLARPGRGPAAGLARAAMRVFARRERPLPGAQLTLFEADDGWLYSPWPPTRPRTPEAGWVFRDA